MAAMRPELSCLDDRPLARVGAEPTEARNLGWEGSSDLGERQICQKISTGSVQPPRALLRDHEKLPEDENVTDNRNNSMRADGSVARRPWEHQHAEKWLQLVRPDKACHAKNKVKLYKYTKK